MKKTLVAAAILAGLAVPSTAWACINSIMRHFTTYPLDFIHFGLIPGAALLFFWADPNRRDPSKALQLAVFFSCAIAGIGYGFIDAKAVALEWTSLSSLGVISSILILLGFVIGSGLPRPDEQHMPLKLGFGRARNVQRLMLAVAIVISTWGAVRANDGYTTEPGHGFQPADPAVASQLTF